MDRKPLYYSYLTNEKVLKRFGSQFELVNHAIKQAEEMINTGREARVKSRIQNRAFLILEEIVHGLDSAPAVVPSEGKAERVVVAPGLVEASDAVLLPGELLAAAQEAAEDEMAEEVESEVIEDDDDDEDEENE